MPLNVLWALYQFDLGVHCLQSQKFCPILPCASASSSVMRASEPKSPQHIAFTGGVSIPPNTFFSLPGRALDPLTPPIGHGRSPLHCHPSPWPGGKDSHHSALLSCPGSSLAQRWSASIHDGSASTGNRVRPSGAQLETQEPLLAPIPLPLSPKSIFLANLLKGQ